MKIFLNKYIFYFFLIQQVLQKKNGQIFFFSPHLLQKVAHIQNYNVLKKLCLGYFFKCDNKIAKILKTENITLSVLEKCSTWYFQIFDNLHIFNHFWKNAQGIVFSTYYIFAYLSNNTYFFKEIKHFQVSTNKSLVATIWCQYLAWPQNNKRGFIRW